MKRVVAVLFCLATLCVTNVCAQSFNQLASDNFVRANQNPLSGNWSRALGITADAQIVSNMVEVSSGPNNTATDYYNAVSWPNDQYSEIVAQADSAGSTGNMMAAVRMSTTENTMYYGGATNGSFGSSVTFKIKKRIAGQQYPTDLATLPSHAYAAGDVIRLAVQGTALTLYLNGVSILTASDASIASGRAGFMIQTDANLADVRFNNWAGGSITGSGAQIFITQTGSPSGACTTGVQSATWFNTAANWGTGAGQIGPGTTVLLCGTFTDTTAGDTLLTFQNGGTSGNPITLLFDTGATLTNTNYWSVNGAIHNNGHDYITVDGGTNGLVQNTGNGSGLANQAQSRGVFYENCANGCVVKNMHVSGIYTHIAGQEDGPLDSTASGIAFNASSNITAGPGNVVTNAANCIEVNAGNLSESNIEIYGDVVSRCNWGIFVGIVQGTLSNVKIHDEHLRCLHLG